MSIWSTCFTLDIPTRDIEGEPTHDRDSHIGIATSVQSNGTIRLSICDEYYTTDAETRITPDEARAIATALNQAADE